VHLSINEEERNIEIDLTQKDEYTVSPYDVLSITVFQHPELSVEQEMVKDDGTITIPRIGSIKVQGLKLSELQKKIQLKLKKILKKPVVSVSPLRITGARYSILGAVSQPGNYPLLKPVTIMDAIGIAGGTTSEASFYRWFLIRKGVVYPLDPRNLKLLKKIYIVRGDTLIVEKTTNMRVIVLGAVNHPGSYPLQSAHPTVWEAIAQAGGFRNDAWRSQIGILHWGKGKVQIRVISYFYPDLKHLQDVFLYPDDVVYVPSSPVGEWNRIISLIQPTLNMFLVQPFGVVRDYYMIQDLRKR